GWKLRGNVFHNGSATYLPLYEAKMIYQFDHRFGDYDRLAPNAHGHVLPDVPESLLQDRSYAPLPRYWVPADPVVERLPDAWQKLWLIGWRDVTDARASSRSVIAGIIPRVGCGDTFLLMFPNAVSPREAALLPAVLNSFVLDYAARQKIGGLHLKYH